MRNITAKAIDKTLILSINGKIYNKVFSTHEELQKVMNVVMQNPNDKEVKEVIDVMTSTTEREKQVMQEVEAKKQETIKQIEREKSLFDLLKDIEENGHEILTVKDNSVYVKGINISLPRKLMEAFVDAEIRTESLLNFWYRCALNPDPRARQDLFDFLQGGKFTITPQGFFVAYRNVRVKEVGVNKALHDLVNKAYLQVKAWKKAPKNYTVVKVENKYDFALSIKVSELVSKNEINKDEVVGNLYDLYHGPKVSGEETVYTDNHTQTMTIKIGEPVVMDRKKCDGDPKRDCSYGLHVGNKSFLSRGSFGSEGLAVLVNPSKVVAVPEYNQNKMRVCEYLPIGVVSYNDRGELEELQTSEFEFDYSDMAQDELVALITSNSTKFEEFKKQELIPLEISLDSLKNISETLDEINKKVANRVKQI